MSLTARPIGIVSVAFRPMPYPEAAVIARDLGFDHIDVNAEWEGELALPIGDRVSVPKPRPGCSHPAPPEGPGMWDRAVAVYRRTPGVLMEPWGGSVCNTIEKIEAMMQEVPGMRLLVDTGHVAGWGEDPVALLPYADHVQLRQARVGEIEVHIDDNGDVEFARVFQRLDELDYEGLCSVEYFDLPDRGWALEDPVGWSTDLMRHCKGLFATA